VTQAFSQLLAVLAVLFCVTPRLARAETQVQLNMSDDEVEVDDRVTVTMKVLLEGQVRPAQPTLDVPAGFDVSNPQTYFSTFNLRINGRQSMRQSFTATWAIAPNREGTFTIPSPTLIIDGETVRANGTLRLKVVAKGTLSRNRRRGFGGMGSFFFGPRRRGFDIGSLLDDDEPLDLQGRELRMTRAPDPHVFLRMIPSKAKAYVGEQITLAYYVYSRSRLSRGDQRLPPLDDFIRYELPSSRRQQEGVLTEAGGRRYFAQLTEQEAIFPIRAGQLHTGLYTRKFILAGRGRRMVERESNDVVIEVVEPPVDGRPAGYRMGDVGRNFRLSAEVAPREVKAGGTISVKARLEGIGRIPNKLKLPERAGIEWYEPEVKEEVQRTRGQLGGWRTFGYAVRLDQPGEVDLGEVALPYWDPKEQRYAVARAKLGTVKVLPGATPGPSAPTAEEAPFAELASPRPQLGAHTPTEDEGVEPSLLWTLVLTPPLGVALAGGVWQGMTGMRRRRRERAEAPEVLAREALSEAARADDAKEAAARCEKALHLAIEAKTGIKSRGRMLDDLSEELTTKGVATPVSEEVVEVLRRCGELRFAPADEADEAITKRTRKLVKALLS